VRAFRSLVFAVVLASTASAFAQSITQAKQPFVDGLAHVLGGVSGAFGDERAIVTAGQTEMEVGLRTWDRAIAQYRDAVAQQLAGASPAMAAGLHVGLGAIYLDRGRADAAVMEFSEAMRLDPSRGDAYRFRALAYQSTGNASAASADFAAAWTRDPRDPAAAYLLLFHRPYDPQRAPEPRAVAALEAFARQRTNEAGVAAPFVRLSLLEEPRADEPVFLPSAYADAARELRQRRYDALLPAIQTAWSSDAINTDPAVTSAPFLAGAAALREGRWKNAIEQLTVAAREQPSSSEAHRLLGMAYWLDDQNGKGVGELRAAIAANPRDERSRMLLADLLISDKQLADAENVLAEATTTLKGSGQAWWRMGRVLELRHRDEEARRARERALALLPVSGESRLLNAIVREYRSESNATKAIEFGRARVASDLNDAAAHDQLGQAYLQAGNDAEALVELLAASLLDPSRSETHSRLAQIYLASGKSSDAAEAAKRAIAIDPNSREARFALGRALQQLGNEDAAKAELAAAERLQLQETEKTRAAMATNLIRTDALLREQQGKWDEAAGLRRDVTASAAAVPSDFTLLGEALSKAGRHAEAIEAFREALGRDSQPEIYQGLIRELAAAGRTADADVARTTYERVKRQRFLEGR